MATKPIAPIANLPNSVQLDGTPYHSADLHPGPCSSVGMRQGTDTQTAMTTIHFTSATPHGKCNKQPFHATIKDTDGAGNTTARIFSIIRMH